MAWIAWIACCQIRLALKNTLTKVLDFFKVQELFLFGPATERRSKNTGCLHSWAQLTNNVASANR